MERADFAISAVAYPEGGCFTIQGIEYDIIAHAERVTDLQEAFVQAVLENIAINLHLGRQPLEGIPAAPQRFKEMFEEATTQISSVRPRPAPPRMRPAPRVSVRLLEAAA